MDVRHIRLADRVVISSASEAKGERHEGVIDLNGLATGTCRRRTERFPRGPIMRNRAGRPWTEDAIDSRFQRVTGKLGEPAKKLRRQLLG